MSKVIFFLGILCLSISSCSKKNRKWEVTESGTKKGCLIFSHSEAESSISPYEPEESCAGTLFSERQVSARKISGARQVKSLMVELPADDTDFLFSDNEIEQHCKFYIYSSETGKYYRQAKGWVKGTFSNNEWTVDFDLYFGQGHAFRLRKGAEY